MSDAMTNLERADMRLNFAVSYLTYASKRICDGRLQLALACIDDAMRDIINAKAKIENEMKGGGS
jgi:hypothetical protein